MKIKIRLLVNGQWWWKLESEAGAFIDAGTATEQATAERAAEAARAVEMRRRSATPTKEDEADGW